MNIPLVEALEKMSGYAKCKMDLVTKKRIISYDTIDNVHYFSAIGTRSLMAKKFDPGVFTIPCTIRAFFFAKVLCDLGENINIIPLEIYQQLGLGMPKLTSMCLFIAD